MPVVYPEGHMLIMGAMTNPDPNLKDDMHEQGGGRRFVKAGKEHWYMLASM